MLPVRRPRPADRPPERGPAAGDAADRRGPAGDAADRPREPGLAGNGAADRAPERGRTGDAVAVAGLVALTVAGLVRFGPTLDRGLWFDEQWRAYHIALPGLGMDLATSYAPMSAGWLLAEKAAAAVSHAEWALRLPTVVALVALGLATYLLARLVTGPAAALLAAAATLVNPATVSFGLQLKPYVPEELVSVALVLVWAAAGRRDGPGRIGSGLLLGLLAVCSVPAVFVLVPLVGLDLAQALRAPEERKQRLRWATVQAAVAGAAALAHFALFVRPQSAILGTEFWDGFFLPRDGGALAFLGRQTEGFLIGFPTGEGALHGVRFAGFALDPLPGGLRWPLIAAQLLLAAAGTRALLRHRVGTGVVTGLFGGLLLVLVGAAARMWPFGFVRVNLFLLPLWWVVLAAGLAALAGHVRQAAALPGRLAAGAGAVLTALALGAVLGHDVGQVTAMNRPVVALDQELPTLLDRVRTQTAPGTIDVVNLDGHQGYGPYAKGWDFYLGQAGREAAVPTLRLGSRDQNAALVRFLADHPEARQVLLYNESGVGPATARAQAAALRAAGFTATGRFGAPNSGQLAIYRRGADPAG